MTAANKVILDLRPYRYEIRTTDGTKWQHIGNWLRTTLDLQRAECGSTFTVQLPFSEGAIQCVLLNGVSLADNQVRTFDDGSLTIDAIWTGTVVLELGVSCIIPPIPPLESTTPVCGTCQVEKTLKFDGEMVYWSCCNDENVTG